MSFKCAYPIWLIALTITQLMHIANNTLQQTNPPEVMLSEAFAFSILKDTGSRTKG